MPISIKKLESIIGDTSRMKVADDERNAPVIIMTKADDDAIATRLFRKHWLDKVGQDNAGKIVVPCARCAKGSCVPCTGRDKTQDSGLYNSLPKNHKDFFDGSSQHEMQLMDLRPVLSELSLYQAAIKSGNAAEASMQLAAIHEYMRTAEIKTWGVSKTVYEMIVRRIGEAREENGGVLVDPTSHTAACPLWISKIGGKYDVTFRWGLKLPVPEEVYANVQKYAEMEARDLQSVAYWSPTRVAEALAEGGHASLLPSIGISVGAPALPAQRVVTDCLPSYSPRPQLPPAPLPPAPAPVIEAKPTVVPQPAVPAGATTSASQLPCFGVAPRLDDPKCASCSLVDDCIVAVRAKIKKPTAPASVTAVAPPKAAPVSDPRVDALVDQAMADVRRADGNKE